MYCCGVLPIQFLLLPSNLSAAVAAVKQNKELDSFSFSHQMSAFKGDRPFPVPLYRPISFILQVAFISYFSIALYDCNVFFARADFIYLQEIELIYRRATSKAEYSSSNSIWDIFLYVRTFHFRLSRRSTQKSINVVFFSLLIFFFMFLLFSSYNLANQFLNN